MVNQLLLLKNSQKYGTITIKNLLQVILILIEWSNKFSNGTIRYTRHNEWDINQDINIEEIREAILATPNYKASGPDGIPIEFYKALIPPDEENSE